LRQECSTQHFGLAPDAENFIPPICWEICLSMSANIVVCHLGHKNYENEDLTSSCSGPQKAASAEERRSLHKCNMDHNWAAFPFLNPKN